MSKRKFVYFWKYVFLILVAIISIFPMYWMIVSGTNKSVDVIVGKNSSGQLPDGKLKISSGYNGSFTGNVEFHPERSSFHGFKCICLLTGRLWIRKIP